MSSVCSAIRTELVAVTRLTSVGLGAPVVVIAAPFTMRPEGVVTTVDAVSSVASLTIEFIIEVASVRQTITIAFYKRQTNSTDGNSTAQRPLTRVVVSFLSKVLLVESSVVTSSTRGSATSDGKLEFGNLMVYNFQL